MFELPQLAVEQLKEFSNEHLSLLQDILRNQKYINVYAYLKTKKEIGAVEVLDSLILLLEKSKKGATPLDRIAGKQIETKNKPDNYFDMNDPSLIGKIKKGKDNLSKK